MSSRRKQNQTRQFRTFVDTRLVRRCHWRSSWKPNAERPQPGEIDRRKEANNHNHSTTPAPTANANDANANDSTKATATTIAFTATLNAINASTTL